MSEDDGRRLCKRCSNLRHLNSEGLCIGCISGHGGSYSKEVKANGVEMNSRPMKFKNYDLK